MPGMTGMEFLTNLKNHPQISSISVFLYSGNVTEDLYAQAQQKGAQTVLSKTYECGSLLKILREVLPSTKPSVLILECIFHSIDPFRTPFYNLRT
jgi:CheY-like chemotaxis protein